MHGSVLAWVADQVGDLDIVNANVLEVGGLNVNGSVRGYFSGPYLATDMRDGPGVDLVAVAADLPFGAGEFDVVVSTEMLEHDRAFWRSLPEMGRVLRSGGILLLTTRGNGFAEHGHPDDYWRFMPSSGAVLAELADCALIASVADPEAPGIFVAARKR